MDTTQTTTTQTVTRSRFKNATVIILFILLTVLAGVGIIVAINLQSSQAPDDSLAAGFDPKTGQHIADDGRCYATATEADNNSGTVTGFYCGGGNACDAASKCATYADMAAVGASNCTTFINKVCQTATCTGEGATPADGKSCCEGLTQCPDQGNRCSRSCSGVIGGNNNCQGGTWNLYECVGACSTSALPNGCSIPFSGANQITNDFTGAAAEAYVRGNGTYASSGCFVRQADCVNTTGANLVFRSGYKCNNQCIGGGSTGQPGTGPGPGTGEPTLYCGDAICSTNELCERTSPGGSSYRACRAGDIGSAPGGAVVNDCYRINDSTGPTGEGARCKYCGDGQFHPNLEKCDPTAPAENGNTPDQCSTACLVINRACIGATKSADTLTPGVGNKVIFSLKFKDERGQNPYVPGIYMRVSSDETDATIVGRDANATSSAKVSLMPTGGQSKVQNPDGSYNYEYKFQWEAASPNGTAVPAGTYKIQFIHGGTGAQIHSDNALCETTITLSVTQVENPVFSVVKTSAPVCESDNDSRIDYTVRVTNSGPVEGVIDSVVDTLDAEVIAAGIVPTNIVPTYGTYATGKITWLGTVADRTYAAGQSKDFTYSLTIPAAQVSSFTGTGIDNQVVVTYDTSDSDDNTDSFTLNTPVACSTPPVTVIPETGIFDDGRFLILGALFVLTGIYVYRRQFILEHSFETEIERKLSRKADGQD